MRSFVKILLSIGTALLFSPGWLSKAQGPTLSKEAQVALRNFFDVDCEVSEQGESLKQLLAFKDVLESALVTILREGPDKQALDRVQGALEEQWRCFRNQLWVIDPQLLF